MFENLTCEFLGRVDYQAGRAIQNRFVERRIAHEIPDTILFCEHPKTLSLGLRTKPTDLQHTHEEYRKLGYDVVMADRGGGPTFHGPGQLVIYPVVNLREHRLGVKRFIDLFLNSIVSSVNGAFGTQAKAKLEPAGIWIDSAREGLSGQDAKLGAVGIRIVQGVTNHGFSLNVCGDLSPFDFFAPCGCHGLQVSSVSGICGQTIAIEDVALAIADGLRGATVDRTAGEGRLALEHTSV